MCQEITISVMPQRLTADDLDAVKRDPLCEIENKDELYKRIGWLICAYDAIVAARIAGRNTVQGLRHNVLGG